MRIAEAAVIGRSPSTTDSVSPASRSSRCAFSISALPMPLRWLVGLDRERRQRHGIERRGSSLSTTQPRKQDVADDLLLVRRRPVRARRRRRPRSASTSSASSGLPKASLRPARTSSRSSRRRLAGSPVHASWQVVLPRAARRAGSRRPPSALPPGALHLDELAPRPRRRRSSGRRRGSSPGAPAPSRQRRAQQLHAAPALPPIRHLAPGAGKGRQAADVVVDLVGRPRPVDARLVLGDLGGIGHALGRLRRQVAASPASSLPSASTISRAPTSRSPSCSSPAVMSAPIGDALGQRDRAGVEALVHPHDHHAGLAHRRP